MMFARSSRRCFSGCWDQLQGSRGGGMAAHKLRGRTEEMQWKPPTLSFNIERHGAMVNGSSRAEVQQWRIDLDRKIAELAAFRRRQKLPMDKRLDVRPLAAEIAAFINAGRSSASSGTERVVPCCNQQGNYGQQYADRGRSTEAFRRRTRKSSRSLLSLSRKRSGTHLVFERLTVGLTAGSLVPLVSNASRGRCGKW